VPGREIAVLQLPGSNCEVETARAISRCGGKVSIQRWNEPEKQLDRFAAYVIPGGFSYQDRIRAGAVAARLSVLDVVARRAGEGAPVLGICNGAQVLVEAGLVPGINDAALDVVLGPNRMPGRSGYYTRWVVLGGGEASGRCIFTRSLGTRLLAMPVAHAEGRFFTRDAGVAEQLATHVALTYRTMRGTPAETFPDNPNQSLESAAGLTNRAGNVLAMMPHPERAILRAQVPERLAGGGEMDLDAEGPGTFLFHSLIDAVGGR
jgi:phosphoribosylformylglycinamidine synthase I